MAIVPPVAPYGLKFAADWIWYQSVIKDIKDAKKRVDEVDKSYHELSVHKSMLKNLRDKKPLSPEEEKLHKELLKKEGKIDFSDEKIQRIEIDGHVLFGKYLEMKRDLKHQFLKPELAERYGRFIEENQKPPVNIPSNVTVLAACEQSSSVIANLRMMEFLSHVRKSESLYGAFISATKDVRFDGANYTKFVVTKREKHWEQAWHKADNDKPHVRRVLLLVPTAGYDKGDTETSKRECEHFKNNCFYEGKPSDEPDLQKRYRVDKVIIVEPPTEKERAAGVTYTDKVKKAFIEAEQFVKDEKALARKNGEDPDKLVFELAGGWSGHGGTWDFNGKKVNPTDPRLYQQGALDFHFVLDEKEFLNKKQMEDFERVYLKDFKYVLQFYNSCHSGSRTALLDLLRPLTNRG